MNIDIIQVLVQVPLVAAVIWFALRLTREFMSAYHEALGELRSVVQHNTEVLAEACAQLCVLDSNTRQAGAENRTLVTSLERLCSHMESHDQFVRDQWARTERVVRKPSDAK